MNRQKREEALRNGQSGKQPRQPNRSDQPDREEARGSESASHERQQPQREPGKLPLPE